MSRKKTGLSDEEMAVFKKNAATFRNMTGLTREQAAAISGVSGDLIKKWEKGQPRSPAGPELSRVANVYGRKSDDFFDPSPSKIADRKMIRAFFLIIHPYAKPDPILQEALEKVVATSNDEHRDNVLKEKASRSLVKSEFISSGSAKRK